MKKKGQIFIVHGGMTFKNRKDYLHFLRTRKVSIEKRVSWAGDYLDKNWAKF
jgi:thymidylate synthase